MTIAELEHYLFSDVFKKRCATVRARQKAGEDLDLQETADGLGLPLPAAAYAMQLIAERDLWRVIEPKTFGRPN
jgi:hypothetical protein